VDRSRHPAGAGSQLETSAAGSSPRQAGWADPGESAEDAARREVEEKTGWTPGPLTELAHYFAKADLGLRTVTVDGNPIHHSEAARVHQFWIVWLGCWPPGSVPRALP
jgi:8-oxo-dGTP pyrophosphatase MutT (NUDIX family)